MKLEAPPYPKKHLLQAVTLMFLIMSTSEVINPQASRPAGRTEFILGPIWDTAGSLGLAAFWGVWAVVVGVRLLRQNGET